MVRKFRKKPVIIEAIQYTGKNELLIMKFVGKKLEVGQSRISGMDNLKSDYIPYIVIPTLEDGPDEQAKHIADPGDWIIRRNSRRVLSLQGENIHSHL
jgi:hypothetical protein